MVEYKKQSTRKIQDYDLIHVVGEGAFARAWKAYDADENVRCLKVFIKNKDDDFKVECDAGAL